MLISSTWWGRRGSREGGKQEGRVRLFGGKIISINSPFWIIAWDLIQLKTEQKAPLPLTTTQLAQQEGVLSWWGASQQKHPQTTETNVNGSAFVTHTSRKHWRLSGVLARPCAPWPHPYPQACLTAGVQRCRFFPLPLPSVAGIWGRDARSTFAVEIAARYRAQARCPAAPCPDLHRHNGEPEFCPLSVTTLHTRRGSRNVGQLVVMAYTRSLGTASLHENRSKKSVLNDISP